MLEIQPSFVELFQEIDEQVQSEYITTHFTSSAKMYTVVQCDRWYTCAILSTKDTDVTFVCSCKQMGEVWVTIKEEVHTLPKQAFVSFVALWLQEELQTPLLATYSPFNKKEDC